MFDFYRTVGGRRFIEHTVPDLIRQLLRVAIAVEHLARVLEGGKEADGVPIAGEGEPR